MTLNAGIFKSAPFAAQKEFEHILTQITACYKCMLIDYTTIENNENKIRNRLWKDYLNHNQIIEHLNIQHWFFDIEHPEVDNNYNETGRSDIKIYHQIERMRNRQAYFIIECKRLDGTNRGKGSLNYEYVENGIKRFIKRDDYPSFYRINGMIGFVVKHKKIDEIISAINRLLDDVEKIIKENIINDFDFTYKSKHSDNRKNEIILYHLMFDYSQLIEKNAAINTGKIEKSELTLKDCPNGTESTIMN